MEILHNIGVDGRILLAQIVNFLVLLFVLQRFVYRPLLAFLDERARKIEQGLKDAEAAREHLARAETEKAEMLDEARAEAKRIVEKSELLAEHVREEILSESRKDAEAILASARQAIHDEKRQVLAEARRELAGLVTAATEKVIAVRLDDEADRELVERQAKI